MTDIQSMAKRLAELERVRSDIGRYSHPDDANDSLALALMYLDGRPSYTMAISVITDGMDEIIKDAKRKMREALDG